MRVDAGFDSGDRVPESYDSLLGKVIAWARTAAKRPPRGWPRRSRRTYCAGVHTNEHWLARILREPRFLAMRHSIAFLDGAQIERTAAAAAEPGGAGSSPRSP